MRIALCWAFAACSEFHVNCSPTAPPETRRAAMEGEPCDGPVCFRRVVPGNNDAIEVPHGCRDDALAGCQDYLVLENISEDPVDLELFDLLRDDTASIVDDLRDLAPTSTPSPWMPGEPGASLAAGECVALVASAEPDASPRLSFDLSRELGTLRLLENVGVGEVCEIDVVFYGFTGDAGDPCDESDESDENQNGAWDRCAAVLDRDEAFHGWHPRIQRTDDLDPFEEDCLVADDR